MPLFISGGLGLVILVWSWSYSCKQQSWSCSFDLGLGVKNLVLFTSLVLAHIVYLECMQTGIVLSLLVQCTIGFITY